MIAEEPSGLADGETGRQRTIVQETKVEKDEDLTFVNLCTFVKHYSTQQRSVGKPEPGETPSTRLDVCLFVYLSICLSFSIL